MPHTLSSSRPRPISFSWSGGKDSALALFHVLQDPRYEVVSLHTTFGEETGRVGMHGVRLEVIERQAAAIGLPLIPLFYPSSGDNAAFERCMADFYGDCQRQGIRHVAFGDIYLEELRAYREQLLRPFGVEAVFPLWGKATDALLREFLAQGFVTAICALDLDKLPAQYAGETLSFEMLETFPPDVDACGEHGEYHTLCLDGPIFKHPCEVLKGDKLLQEYSYRTSDGLEHRKRFLFHEFL
ncbi:Dph6-related ATP pyrophosphatase [Nitritalea halalkaliphila]|nr:ATP-binding protein [Nitritalea halalkaliphila]